MFGWPKSNTCGVSSGNALLAYCLWRLRMRIIGRPLHKVGGILFISVWLAFPNFSKFTWTVVLLRKVLCKCFRLNAVEGTITALRLMQRGTSTAVLLCSLGPVIPQMQRKFSYFANFSQKSAISPQLGVE